jgi:hypothetical protein
MPHGQPPARELPSRSADGVTEGGPSTGMTDGGFRLRGVFVSQQQPDLGFVTQQQPFRNISPARALPVEADATSGRHSVPMTAMKTARRTRNCREQDLAMPTPEQVPFQLIDYTH